MNPEDIVADVANELIFNDFTASNTLGAVVGAVATVGFLGVTGPITVTLALAGGALVGAKGEEALKSTARGIKYTVYNVAKGTSSIIENTAKGFAGVLDLFKSSEDFVNRGLERIENEHYKEAIEDFTQAINIEHKNAEAYFVRGCTYSDLGNYQEAIADYTCTIKIDSKYADAYVNR